MVTIIRTKRTEASRLLAHYGPWAVVTGATDGIGRELARQLAVAGLNVFLVARRTEPLARLAEELRQASGVEVQVLPADLSRPEVTAAVAASTAGLPVGLLVAAAGFGTSGSFVDGDLDEELELIDLNCRAVAALAHHFGGRFARQGRGGLILMSSLVAFQGVPRSANYGRVRMMGLVMSGMTSHQASAPPPSTAANRPAGPAPSIEDVMTLRHPHCNVFVLVSEPRGSRTTCGRRSGRPAGTRKSSGSPTACCSRSSSGSPAAGWARAPRLPSEREGLPRKLCTHGMLYLLLLRRGQAGPGAAGRAA